MKNNTIKRIIGIFILMMSMLPSALAADAACTDAEPLDLFCLLVEGVFGSVLLAGLGLVLLILFIGTISRMSKVLLIFIVVIFVTAFATGFVGALVAVPVFTISFIYFASQLMKFINQYR